jgi:hypothetical protein
MQRKWFIRVVLSVFILLSLACTKNALLDESTLIGGKNPNAKTFRVSWTASKEKAVNRAGGGYKVYFSESSGFTISGAGVVDVPYVSGASSPTSATVEVDGSGTYYVKIKAYSSINGGSESEVSDETSVVVP